jgi:hypothetical protein
VPAKPMTPMEHWLVGLLLEMLQDLAQARSRGAVVCPMISRQPECYVVAFCRSRRCHMTCVNLRDAMLLCS